MSKFVVSINVGGGSMAEAMQPEAIYGPFTSKQAAKTFEEMFYKVCKSKSEFLEEEMLTTVIEITEPCYIDEDDPRLEGMDLQGKKAIDCILTADHLFEGEYYGEGF